MLTYLAIRGERKRNMFDLRINKYENAEPMSYGFFEKMNKLSCVPWSDDDYTVVGKYRIHKHDANNPEIRHFLRLAEKQGKLYE